MTWCAKPPSNVVDVDDNAGPARVNGELKRFIPPKAARWKGRVHNALHVESSVVQYSPEIRFLTCYYRSGTTFLGKVSTENCDTIRFQHYPCLKTSGTPIAQFGNKTGICDITAPGIRGTRIVEGFYWLCVIKSTFSFLIIGVVCAPQ